ncbi:MAG TPA: hypothetical protein DIW17_04570 [Clostridiales bacterium]|nr:hypothetical protein [Clostridiales bacterium]
MVFVLSTFTQPGQAALEKLKKYFELEKLIGYEVEGEKENIDSRLQQGALGYVMYYDQERYKVVEDGQMDRYVMKETTEEIPEVYLEVSQDLDNTPGELAAKLEAELKADFSKVDAPKEVADPLEALYILRLMEEQNGMTLLLIIIWLTIPGVAALLSKLNTFWKLPKDIALDSTAC